MPTCRNFPHFRRLILPKASMSSGRSARPESCTHRPASFILVTRLMATPKSKTSGGSAAVIDNSVNNGSNPERERVFSAFRQWGYLEGDLDPLGFLRPRPHPDLQIENEYAREARAIYCSTIGVEINHISDPERRNWIYQRLESEAEEVDQQRALDLLIRADLFEQVLQQRYLGSKRFSLEGVTALLPLVDEIQGHSPRSSQCYHVRESFSMRSLGLSP